MDEFIDLTIILKGVPEGTKFWHSVFGKVAFVHIGNDAA